MPREDCCKKTSWESTRTDTSRWPTRWTPPSPSWLATRALSPSYDVTAAVDTSANIPQAAAVPSTSTNDSKGPTTTNMALPNTTMLFMCSLSAFLFASLSLLRSFSTLAVTSLSSFYLFLSFSQYFSFSLSFSSLWLALKS